MVQEKVSNSVSQNGSLETRSVLDKLLDKVEKSTAGEELAKLKQEVMDFSVFEGQDEDGVIFEKITVGNILKDPLKIVKGLAIEAIDSYPFLEGIYKWIFIDESKDYGFSKTSSDKIFPIADEYYIQNKNIDVSTIEGLDENEVDMLSEIQKEGGPNAMRVLKLYESSKDISRQMERKDFIELMKDIGQACEAYGLQKDIFIPYALGTIKKESAFKKMAWNSSGATGLWQHMTQFLPKRLASASKILDKQGIQYDKKAVLAGSEFFKSKDKTVRKNRSIWPNGVEELVFGSQMQSFMTMELTQENYKSLKSALGERAETFELYDFLYIAHNMGLTNALKIAKGQSLGSWATRRLNMLKRQKVISGVTNYALKVRKELYGENKMSVV